MHLPCCSRGTLICRVVRVKTFAARRIVAHSARPNCRLTVVLLLLHLFVKLHVAEHRATFRALRLVMKFAVGHSTVGTSASAQLVAGSKRWRLNISSEPPISKWRALMPPRVDYTAPDEKESVTLLGAKRSKFRLFQAL